MSISYRRKNQRHLRESAPGRALSQAVAGRRKALRGSSNMDRSEQNPAKSPDRENLRAADSRSKLGAGGRSGAAKGGQIRLTLARALARSGDAGHRDNASC